MKRMRQFFTLASGFALAAALVVLGANATLAQTAREATFIQVQSVPSLRSARAAAQRYAGRVAEVNGFRAGRWYVVAIGPFTPDEASERLGRLRAEGRVPRDSFLTEGTGYGNQFWPVGADVLAEPFETPDEAPALVPELAIAAAPEAEPVAATPAPLPEETLREAQASERQLSRDEKKQLQIALKWEGFYTSAIDGAYGRGTRRAMSDWQASKGYETTGVLTTRQRAELLRDYDSVFDGLAFEEVDDPEAGIRIKMPTAAVAFSEYETPFAKYEPMGDEPIQVLLISQEGDRRTLGGLYEIMQTLEIVPPEGPRERNRDSFTLVGEDSETVSETYVRHEDGRLKGFTLIWPAGDERRRGRVIADMRASFAETTTAVLDDALATPGHEQRVDLLAGLQIRRPSLSRSGFFVDRSGTVVTSAELGACGDLRIDESHPASVLYAGDKVAVIRPSDPLAPMAAGTIRDGVPRLGAEIAVAGFPFGGSLGAPTLSFGTLADLQGPSGEADIERLDVSVAEGDAGAPVLGEDGTVIGMVVPAVASGRALPDGVGLALDSAQIVAALREAGVRADISTGERPRTPEDVTRLAGEMATLVTCWD